MTHASLQLCTLLLSAASLVSARLSSLSPDIAADVGAAPPPRRRTGAANPKCRPLQLAEWANLLQTETEAEFDLTQEASDLAASADPDGFDPVLLLARAQLMWEDNTSFEFDRALRIRRELSQPAPFVVCSETPGLSGFRRRRLIRTSIMDALRANRRDAVYGKVILRTLYSSDDMLCGFVLMDGAVAEGLEFDDCVVQPMIMPMKLMPRTVQLLLEKANECADEIEQRERKDEEDKDDPKPTVLETLLSKEGEDGDGEDGANKNDEDGDGETSTEGDGGGGLDKTDTPKCSAIENLTSATIDISLCPGILDNDLLEQLRSEDSDVFALDITDEITSWLTSKTGTEEASTEVASTKEIRNIAEEVYWTSSKATEFRRAESKRGEVWREALDEAASTDRCDEVYTSRLTWTVEPGQAERDFTVIRVVYNATMSEGWEKACVMSLIAGVAVRPDVCSLELVGEASTSNFNAQWMTQSGVEGERPWFDVGLDGSGQVVALSDTGIDVDNCYFQDADYPRPSEELDTNGHRKIAMYWPYGDGSDEELGHGTHVAATIAGSRAPEGTYEEPGAANGVAQGAKIAFVDISGEPGILDPPRDNDVLSVGRVADTESSPIAHIHSMSWGSSSVTYYNNQARNFDNYQFSNDDFLVVVAAGNQGRYDKETSVGAPGNGKNILSVGASHSFGADLTGGQLGSSYIADFSSRGPTPDGRIAPDIVAPGKYILSAAARPNQPGSCDPPNGELPGAEGNIDGLYSQGGSSMAAPIVAGTAALIRQYFEEGWHGDGTKNSGDPVNPSGAMVKAILMNGAQTNMNGVDNGSRGVTPVKPYDNAMGFGRISLTNSLYIAGKSDVQLQFWDREMISDGDDVRRYDIEIDMSNGCTTDQLSVTLAWLEEGSPSGCTKCVLNDLDLFITEKGKETITYFPNGRSAKDSLNNVERIMINGVVDGDSFTVHVDAHNLEAPTQNFALVATGCFGGVANELDTTAKNVFSMDESTYVEENNQTTMILIIVFSVLGGILALCVCFALIKRRRKIDNKEAAS